MITNVSKENNLGPGDKPEFRGERCRTCPRVGGGGWHRCNINFSNGQSIGIVLYGMCSHSLYIKGEN